MAPFSGVFENYTGSSEDSNSRSVDAMQEEVCTLICQMDMTMNPYKSFFFVVVVVVVKLV